MANACGCGRGSMRAGVILSSRQEETLDTLRTRFNCHSLISWLVILTHPAVPMAGS